MRRLRFNILLLSIMSFAYYVYDAHKNSVAYELIIEIPLPNEDYNSQFVGFDVVDTPQRLHFWLFDNAQQRKVRDTELSEQDYTQLLQMLDFDQYDYFITYHRKIDKLYWTRNERRMFKTKSDLRIPLEVELQKPNSSRMYIYRISPKGQYRACPG